MHCTLIIAVLVTIRQVKNLPGYDHLMVETGQGHLMVCLTTVFSHFLIYFDN
jgi:hypothetical protein